MRKPCERNRKRSRSPVGRQTAESDAWGMVCVATSISARNPDHPHTQSNLSSLSDFALCRMCEIPRLAMGARFLRRSAAARRSRLLGSYRSPRPWSSRLIPPRVEARRPYPRSLPPHLGRSRSGRLPNGQNGRLRSNRSPSALRCRARRDLPVTHVSTFPEST